MDDITISRRMRDANISRPALKTTLELLKVPQLRNYVTDRDWGVGINFGIRSVKGARCSRQEARTVFHCLAKELVLSDSPTIVLGLTELCRRMNQGGNALDELIDVQHLLITHFYVHGLECPLTPFQIAEVTEYIEERANDERATHLMMFVIASARDVSEWYGDAFAGWIDEINDFVSVDTK